MRKQVVPQRYQRESEQKPLDGLLPVVRKCVIMQARCTEAGLVSSNQGQGQGPTSMRGIPLLRPIAGRVRGIIYHDNGRAHTVRSSRHVYATVTDICA